MQIDWNDFFTNSYNLSALGAIIIYIIIAGAFYAGMRNPKILQSIPGASASIGVFFTFWVLYQKLSTFTLDDASDSFLITIVRDLSGAFSTSIIGLFVSVISNIIIKLHLAWLENKAIRTKPWEKMHPKALLYDIHQSSEAVRNEIWKLRGGDANADLVKIQISQEKLFGEVLREQRSTKGRLSEDLSELAASMHTIQASIVAVKTDISAQLKTIKGAGENGDLAGIHKQLDKLNSGVLEELQGLFETLNEKLTEMLGQLGEDVLSRTSEDLKKLNIDFTKETGKLLKQNLKAMNARFELQRKESEASAQEHIEQFKNVNKGLHATREQLNQEVASIENKFTSAIDNITTSFSSQSETLKNALNEKINEIKTSFETGVGAMAEAYNDKGDEIQSTYEQVEDALKGFNEQIQSNVDETLRKNLEQLEGTFKRLEELQSRSTANLSDTTKSFTEAVDKNQQIALEQSEVLKKVQAQYEAVENLRTDMKELIDKWGKYSEKLHHLQDHIAGLTNIILQLDKSTGHMNGLNQNGNVPN